MRLKDKVAVITGAAGISVGYSRMAILLERGCGIASGAVHGGGAATHRGAQKVCRTALPETATVQITPSTCAQTASMARNKLIDASAKASSATARTMVSLPFV